MRVLVAHPGTQYAPHLATELFARSSLSRFATGFVLPDSALLSAVERILPNSLKRRYSHRRISTPSKAIKVFPRLELLALWRLRRGKPEERVLHARNRAFQNAIPDRWIMEATHTIGFDTSSWILAERSASLGRSFVLDRSIGHSRVKERIYENLRKKFPEWAETIQRKVEFELNCEDVEHRTAKHIVVPSAFVRDTLVEEGLETSRISIIPFGTDLDLFRPAKAAPPGAPIIFLYAGMLSARKGLPVLLEAWKEANLGSRAELWLAGTGQLPATMRRTERVRFFGRLQHKKLAELMRRAHAFVFPSFFEGLAQVQIEALATGLPVIATRESGANEIVDEGETGFIIPAGSVNRLAECLNKLTGDSVARHRLRERCIQTRDSRSWRSYGDKWFSLLRELNEN